jgi:hypothetical protein
LRQPAGLPLAVGAAVAEKYQFKNLQRTNFSINWMANKLNVTRNGYYAWLHRQENLGPRAQEEKQLGNAIDPIFKDHKVRYG